MQTARSRSQGLAILVAAGFAAVGLIAACSGSGEPSDEQPLVTDGMDASLPFDADAGEDGADAGPDGGFNPDSGAIEFGTTGPWPLEPVTLFGSANGLLESRIVDVSTDEAQNLWVVSRSALYLLRPGETTFQRFTAADGLSLDNAMPPGITAVVGGAPGEAFVGYQGADLEDTQKDPLRFRGKLDRVLLQADGSLDVTFYNVHNNDVVGFNPDGTVIATPEGCPEPGFTDWSFNEDRTVHRFLYDHLHNRGALYVGYNHGVARFEPGRPDPITCFDYADHIHPVVYNTEGTQRMGDWHALALDPVARPNRSGELQSGLLWMGGRWTAGASHWTPSLYDWARNERNPFWVAFSDTPVFPVVPGESIYLRGIAPLSDGSVYFASGIGYGDAAPRGIAVWRARQGFVRYLAPGAIGLPSASIIDFQALPDDTILIAVQGQGLWHWDPQPEPNGRMIGKIGGLPSDDVTRVSVDQMVSPPAVYVSTGRGFALLRFP